MTFHGRVEQGQIYLDLSEEWAARVARLEGKPIEITLRRERGRRDALKGYYWGIVLRTFATAVRCDSQALHEALKRKLLLSDPVGPLVITRSTEDMNAAEFSAYVDKVVALAARMNVFIDGPIQAVKSA